MLGSGVLLVAMVAAAAAAVATVAVVVFCANREVSSGFFLLFFGTHPCHRWDGQRQKRGAGRVGEQEEHDTLCSPAYQRRA